VTRTETEAESEDIRESDDVQVERRAALKLVRADRMVRSIDLLESIRKMCLCLLMVLVALGLVTAFMVDYMTDNRAILAANQAATEDVDEAFKEFSNNNQAYLDNHARTQRLICAWFVANELPLPDNGDCDNR
jgi:hypothetical protein